MVMAATVVISLLAGLAFRRRFRGAGALFTLTVASLIMPSILVSLGIGLLFSLTGLDPDRYSSAFGAQLTWTLPFGLLIMFAVFNRFDRAWEEAARDLGATPWQRFRHVVLPIIAPSVVGIALFGFTLSYDEFARTLLTAGSEQHPAAGDLRHDHELTTPVLFTRWAPSPPLCRSWRSACRFLDDGGSQARRDDPPVGISAPGRPTGIPAQIPPMPQ